MQNNLILIFVGSSFQSFSNFADCFFVSQCLSSEFQSSAPTLTSNRICSALSDCPAGRHVILDASPTSDRVCSVCPVGNFKPLPGLSACLPAQGCNISQFRSVDSTSTSDAQCLSLSNCDSGTYTAAAPTPTSDRLCHNLTNCLPSGLNTSRCASPDSSQSMSAWPRPPRVTAYVFSTTVRLSAAAVYRCCPTQACAPVCTVVSCEPCGLRCSFCLPFRLGGQFVILN